MDTSQQNIYDRRDHRSTAAEVANTFEWIITAFVLAFVFRAFVMEAFRIPTGSMADTLQGAHFRLCCGQCGYGYEYSFSDEQYGLTYDSDSDGEILSYPTRCPSCGFIQKASGLATVANGDRILVLKCIYQFFEPRRWDVVVFKNPLDPHINYIKRLVGLPGETVEIIDGDIYIDGLISRKPPQVQAELWMPVYDNDYQPVRPRDGSFNGHIWEQPLRNVDRSRWQVGQENPTRFTLDSGTEQVHTMVYDTHRGNDFRATYAYNEIREYEYMPYCSDLKVGFHVEPAKEPGQVGATLSKYENVYRGWVDFGGSMHIVKVSGGQETELASREIELPAAIGPRRFEFINVDHQLILRFGAEQLSYDLGRGVDDAGVIDKEAEPVVKIFGAGELTVWHVSIFRDIHYTGKRYTKGKEGGRAIAGNALKLEADEFFVLGDNSPSSEDGRWWASEGIGNGEVRYRAGIVPRDYMIGKALYVYWPGGFSPFGKLRLAIIPNYGKMRFIHGGSDKTL